MHKSITLILGVSTVLATLINTANAATTTNTIKTETTTVVTAPVTTTHIEPAHETIAWSKKDVYVSTNFIDLSKGNGNVSGDFFIKENLAASFSFRTASIREKVKIPETINDTEQRPVDRSSYILGVSYFPMGVNKQINLLLNPGIAFGTKKTPYDVENQIGFSVKASAFIRSSDKLGFELGMKGNNLEEGSFTTDLYAGLGLLF